jgi:hypothetical protein
LPVKGAFIKTGDGGIGKELAWPIAGGSYSKDITEAQEETPHGRPALLPTELNDANPARQLLRCVHGVEHGLAKVRSNDPRRSGYETAVGGHCGELTGVNRAETTRDMRQAAGSVLLCVFLLLVIYVVSIGPAAWVHKKAASPIVQDELLTVYAPVVFLINQTPLHPIGAWWIDRWVDVPESRLWLVPPKTNGVQRIV